MKNKSYHVVGGRRLRVDPVGWVFWDDLSLELTLEMKAE